VAGIAVLGACGGDTTAPPVTGATQGSISSVVIMDNPNSTTSTSQGGSATGTYFGTVNGTVQAQISVDGLAWTAAGDPQAIAIPLQRSVGANTIVADAPIPLGTYIYARLVFAGGAGAQVFGTVNGFTIPPETISFGSGGSVVEVPIAPVLVTPGSSYHLVFDLNTELWLTPAVVQARAVSPDVMARAMFAAMLRG
jgi:hypothetical protein